MTHVLPITPLTWTGDGLLRQTFFAGLPKKPARGAGEGGTVIDLKTVADVPALVFTALLRNGDGQGREFVAKIS